MKQLHDPRIVLGNLATLVPWTLSVIALAAVAGCSSPDDSVNSGDDELRKGGAKQGQTCASGVFGTPHIACAKGLVCEYPNDSTAPSGPSGSSSASTGTCQPAGAKQGETCASGVFGTPDLPCADGLVCKYPTDSTAPSGPSGSSSASTGTCQAK